MYRLLFITPIFFILACSDTPSTTQHETPESLATAKKAPAAQKQTKVAEPKKVALTAREGVNGHSLYAHQCASCHGQKGEKAALNTSQVIAGWPTEKTVHALNGYRDGSYGHKLKGIMKGQVSSLDPTEIEAVASYIKTL